MEGADRLRILPFPLLVDEAWRVTRAHVRRLFVPLALVLGPVALVLNLANGYWSMEAVRPTGDPFASCGLLLLLLGLVLAGMVAIWGIYGVLMVATVRLTAGDPIDWGRDLRFFLHPRVWGTDLLAWILISIGFLACILPGVVLMTMWGLRMPVMVREGRFGFAALSRSRELLRNRGGAPWTSHPLLKMFLVVVLGIVLGYAVTLVVQLPPTIAGQLLMMREMAAGEAADPASTMRAVLWLTIPAGVLASLAQLGVRIYLDFVIALLHRDQWRRREGRDLEAELDRLQGASVGAGRG
ncbi:MAG: hypothetical protein R3234_09145 [Thermoanaerobaculia bacterium]|nr:hypothetical protein [Thermoanaerobaculia bacterium]